MDKEEQQKPLEEETVVNSSEDKVDDNNQADTQQAAEEKKEEVELTPEDKIKELEDKLARTFAEMENQFMKKIVMKLLKIYLTHQKNILVL